MLRRLLGRPYLLVVVPGAAVLVALVCGVRPFTVPSTAMQPAHVAGENLVGVPILTSPQRADIVVFHANGRGADSFPPTKGQPRTMAETSMVKRLIGLPGEEVAAHGGTVWVCVPGARAADLEHPENTRGCAYLKEPYTHGQKTWQYGETGQALSPINVPKGEYLMLGDNRELSRDGRFFGTVRESQLQARAFMTFWPLTRISFL